MNHIQRISKLVKTKMNYNQVRFINFKNNKNNNKEDKEKNEPDHSQKEKDDPYKDVNFKSYQNAFIDKQKKLYDMIKSLNTKSKHKVDISPAKWQEIFKYSRENRNLSNNPNEEKTNSDDSKNTSNDNKGQEYILQWEVNPIRVVAVAILIFTLIDQLRRQSNSNESVLLNTNNFFETLKKHHDKINKLNVLIDNGIFEISTIVPTENGNVKQTTNYFDYNHFEDQKLRQQQDNNIPPNQHYIVEFDQRKNQQESNESGSLSSLFFIASLYFLWTMQQRGINPGSAAARLNPKSGKKPATGGNGSPFENMFQNISGTNTDINVIDPENIDTRFNSVAGLTGSKQEIMEFVEFLKNPKKQTQMGAKIPRGSLLVGPPGTGKTLLAKATAGEAGVPFININGSEFVEMFVGLGARRVRKLFETARSKSPCIIFIDEIDAVGKKRDGGGGGGRGNDERDQTLNQLLVEMDGIGTDENVVVLAATNMKDSLDKALTRPGRFDRIIDCPLPTISEREEIFKIHLAPLKLSSEFSIADQSKRLASLSPGYSGAEIKNICNEAAILAARENSPSIISRHFEDANDRVLAGLRRDTMKLSLEETKRVAQHEAGHAICGWFLKGADPVLKVTIIPRSKGSLGFSQQLPNEFKLTTKEDLEDRLVALLAGRAAEEVFFGNQTNGASDDLNKVTQISQNMIASLGMSEKLGHIGYQLDGDSFKKPFSSKTNELIDNEVQTLIAKSYKRAIDLVTQKKVVVEALAQRLLEKETIVLKDLHEILGERPYDLGSEMNNQIQISQNHQQIVEEQVKEFKDKKDNEVQIDSNEEEVDKLKKIEEFAETLLNSENIDQVEKNTVKTQVNVNLSEKTNEQLIFSFIETQEKDLEAKSIQAIKMNDLTKEIVFDSFRDLKIRVQDEKDEMLNMYINSIMMKFYLDTQGKTDQDLNVNDLKERNMLLELMDCNPEQDVWMKQEALKDELQHYENTQHLKSDNDDHEKRL